MSRNVKWLLLLAVAVALFIYQPRSILYGAVLSAVALAATWVFGAILWWRERRSMAP